MLWITLVRSKLILATLVWSTVFSGFAHADWYRGNTHTHTVLCGHGDSSPEAVTQWYHDRGYHFLILSEHNIYIDPKTVRMPQNKRNDFILIPGQEVTGKPIGIHTTAMNVNELIPWQNQETDTKTKVMQEHIHHTHNAGGLPILNHPHGGSAVTSDEILPVKDFQMMEVYNANTKRNNLFKRRYLNLSLTAEPLWDELLTAGKRVYGVGSDDAHTFMTIGPNETNAGLGYRIEFIGPNGGILNVVKGTQATYALRGSETYVRARAVWVRKRDDGDFEAFYAWGQPVFLEN